jgi:hypothetical protein
VIAILCLLLPDAVAIITFFIITAVLIFVPVIYSYRLFKKNKEAGSA